MLSLRTDLASINILASMQRNQQGLANSLERVSSGRRVNRAADDAAGLATAVNLETRISSTRMAMRNTNDGISIIQTAEGELGTAIDSLQRMRELAVQSASGTITDTERGYMNDEFVKLRFSLKDASLSSSFNGISLLDGSPATISVQAGAGDGANNRIDIDMANAAAAYGAVTSSVVSSESNALDAIDDVDAAVQLLNSDRSKLGAAHNRLLSSLSFSERYTNALTASMSDIIDTDFAIETSNLTKQQLMQSAGSAALLQAREITRAVVDLI